MVDYNDRGVPFETVVLPRDGAVVDGLEALEVIVGAGQPEYLPLRALRSNDPSYRFITRWTFTPAQRAAVAAGADLFLTILTAGRGVQPVALQVGMGLDPAEVVEEFKLVPPFNLSEEP